jgi:uncharacterized protein (DUF2141 family)
MALRSILSAVVLLTLATGQALAADLTVYVDGVRSSQGSITLSLYDNARDWLSDNHSIADLNLPAHPGRVVGVFRNLKPGRYAVVTMHDDDDSGHMRFSLLGLPEKGYAFSRNVRPVLSAPSFDDAAITLGTSDAAISILMVYP